MNRAHPPAWILVLLVLWVGWLAVGIFPIGPVEGDEQGVINGATALARGETAYFQLAYLPVIQPGSYALLSQASRWTGIGVEPLFAVGTVAGVLMFVWFSTRILAKTLALPWWIALAGLLWCQEVSAAASYMNTTALGMGLTFAALWLACRPPNWPTIAGMAALVAVAGWIRVDCLLPTPAIPVLLWINGASPRVATRVTVIVAAASLALVAALYAASGVSWHELTRTFAERGAIEGWWPTVRAMPLLLSPLLCGLLVAGLIWLVIRREGRWLALIAAGSAPTLFVYGTSLASTKYFYPLVPFLLLAVFHAASRLGELLARAPRPWRLAGFAVAGLLAVSDQGVALQTSSPEFRRYTPEPVLATLATVPGPRRPAKLVIGCGELIPTTDGFRARGGAGFAPWAWHREKAASNAQLGRFPQLLAGTTEATVFFSGWLPYQMLVRMLRGAGYEFRSPPLAGTTMPFAGLWQRGDHRVHTAYLAYQRSEFFDRNARPANETGRDTYFIGDLNGFEPITELADEGTRSWQPLWPRDVHRFVVFCQRMEKTSSR